MNRKTLILAAILSVAVGAKVASAQQTTIEVGYVQSISSGALCSSGTAIQLNEFRPTGLTGERIAGYRIRNAGSLSFWLRGASTSIATHTVAGVVQPTLGEEIESGDSVTYHLGKGNRGSRGTLWPLYCKADDDAGADGVPLSVVWFAY